MTSSSLVVAIAAFAAATSLATAQPASPVPPLVGATKVHAIAPTAGFIEDAIAVDNDRLAYVVNGDRSELRVVSLGTKQEHVVDLSALTTWPRSLHFVGPKVLVIGHANEPNKQVAALVDPAAKGKPVVYKLVANEATFIVRDGKPRLAIKNFAASKTPQSSTIYVVSVHAVENGRRLVGPGKYETDLTKSTGISAKLGFAPKVWTDGFTRVLGIKEGAWNKQADQRLPDVEATLDIPTGKLVSQTPIKDLHEHRRRLALLVGKHHLDFVAVKPDHSGLVVARAGAIAPLALDQPFDMYLRDSLQQRVSPEGIWLALKIDKVHPAAVARKKADIEYLDVFRAADAKPSTAAVTASRKARVFAGTTRYHFGSAGADRFWLLERNAAIDRGGKSLVLYEVQ